MKSLLHLLLFIILFFGMTQKGDAQNQVAITIDDVPNTILFQKSGGESLLLKRLDSLNIPTTVFINEALLFKNDSIIQNIRLLENWISNTNIQPGNHTYSHLRYSDTDVDTFVEDYKRGTYLSAPLAEKYDKQLEYFRFPYNDLGMDSLQHLAIRSFFSEKQKITPFTIESSDWMFNAVYIHSLEQGDNKKAENIGMMYVDKTLAYFDHFEAFAKAQFNRNIKQIYLCHDNKLNSDFLPIIIQKLKERDYTFIALDHALDDSAYQSDDTYYKKWGVSWLYRWADSETRKKWFQREPTTTHIQELYDSLSN